MLFKTEFKPTEDILIAVPDNLIQDVIDINISDELSKFIISKKCQEKDEHGVYKTELFVTSKDNWIKLRRLINIYSGSNLPYELESLLLAMEQQ